MTHEKHKHRKNERSRKKDPNKEIIKYSIISVQEAKRQIVDDAKNKVLKLDWSRFGALSFEPGLVYDISLPMILNNSSIQFPLGIVDKKVQPDLLDGLSESRKMQLTEDFYLITTVPVITSTEATLTRDWLWIKAPENIARMNNISPEEALTYFGKRDVGLLTAGYRVQKILGPEI